MLYLRCSKIACLIAAMALFAGCESKQDKPKAGPVVSADKAAAPTAVPAQKSPVAAAASPRDMTDVRAAAQKILAKMEAGDFAAIYSEASPVFKKIGSETAFVTKFQQTRLKTGALKNPRELSFVTRPDSVHVAVYRVENERFVTDIRLSFQRAKNGTMELAGLNQHDELKQQLR